MGENSCRGTKDRCVSKRREEGEEQAADFRARNAFGQVGLLTYLPHKLCNINTSFCDRSRKKSVLLMRS